MTNFESLVNCKCLHIWDNFKSTWQKRKMHLDMDSNDWFFVIYSHLCYYLASHLNLWFNVWIWSTTVSKHTRNSWKLLEIHLLQMVQILFLSKLGEQWLRSYQCNKQNTKSHLALSKVLRNYLELSGFFNNSWWISITILKLNVYVWGKYTYVSCLTVMHVNQACVSEVYMCTTAWPSNVPNSSPAMWMKSWMRSTLVAWWMYLCLQQTNKKYMKVFALWYRQEWV